jgi:PAS domain S-box-containing protein
MRDERHLELIGDAQDAVIVHDAAAVVVDVNEEACRSLGYTREELVGRHVRDFVEGLSAPELARVTGLLRRRGFVTARAVHRRKDGSRFRVETRLAVLRRDGPPQVVAFARDLTAEERAQRALHESQARYRSLVDLLPDGVVIHGGGRIVFANAVAARLMGTDDPRALVGTPVMDRVHPDCHEAVRQRMARVASGEPAPLVEEVLVRLDGTCFPAEVAAAPLGEETLVVVRDLSERRRVEAERALLEERLRHAEKMEALGTLAGGVAHDFNNVLAAILGHAAALAGEQPPGSSVRADAEQIAAAARRAKGVVQQILAFARRRPPEITAVDVALAVREELPLLRAATPANVEIVSRSDVAAAVRADASQIHQVLINLCANARDAMGSRGGVLEIAVEPATVPGAERAPSGLAPGAYVRLSVSDTGLGMDAATRARAFEPYFTTKPLGVGSGLGLSVVHGIAAGLGGAVTLDSARGRGTTVTVWLPRAADAQAPQPRPGAPVAGPRHRVLLVDDDPTVARAIGRMLEHTGYDVTVEGDAESALRRFQADPAAFDLVLTDQTLPRMRGDELTRALLALRPALPVVICTGYSEELDEERARALGARALLPKPLDVRELAQALREAIGSA